MKEKEKEALEDRGRVSKKGQWRGGREAKRLRNEALWSEAGGYDRLCIFHGCHLS